MATLREVRNRISGVRKTQKITKAMKMVAAAKLRRAQMNVLAARPYALQMKMLLRHLSPYAEGASAALITPRPLHAAALFVVTSDRGMCGAFNANLLKTVTAHVAQQYAGFRDEGKLRVYCVGRKGVEFFARRGFAMTGKYVGVYNNLVFAPAQSIAREIIDAYSRGEFDRVDVFYNEFKSVGQHRIAVEQFLPIQPPAGGDDDQPGRVDYIYEPSAAELLRALVPRHLHFQVWRMLLESNAAEQGARMAAMENATENANDLIETLQLQYNKARQAAITKELLEVVSGAEALHSAG
jgi:F-type H+-transporting ATPase subunit gamma